MKVNQSAFPVRSTDSNPQVTEPIRRMSSLFVMVNHGGPTDLDDQILASGVGETATAALAEALKRYSP